MLGIGIKKTGRGSCFSSLGWLKLLTLCYVKMMTSSPAPALQVRKAVTEFIPASFASVGSMAKAYYKAERRCVRGCVLPLLGSRRRSTSLIDQQAGSMPGYLPQRQYKYCPLHCRHVYTTPKTFLELIKLYRNLLVGSRCWAGLPGQPAVFPAGLPHFRCPARHAHPIVPGMLPTLAAQARKRQAVQASIERLETGLTKLRKTQGDVDVLVEQAQVMSLEVEQKVAAANQFADTVSAAQAGCTPASRKLDVCPRRARACMQSDTSPTGRS